MINYHYSLISTVEIISFIFIILSLELFDACVLMVISAVNDIPLYKQRFYEKSLEDTDIISSLYGHIHYPQGSLQCCLEVYCRST